MILYHGTTIEMGKQIIQDGVIKANITRNYCDYSEQIKNTTNGYVYLTANLYTAYYYGNINLISINDFKNKYVSIFKISVPEHLLLPDYDELKTFTGMTPQNLTSAESLDLCGCVRVDMDVPVDDANYMVLPGTANLRVNKSDVEMCARLSKMQINGMVEPNVIDDILKRFEWKSVN